MEQGNQSGEPTKKDGDAKISDVKSGVVTLDYVPAKQPQQPVRH